MPTLNNKQIIEKCTDMNIGDKESFTTDHELRGGEIPFLTATIAHERLKKQKQGVVGLRRSEREITASCYKGIE